MITRKQKEETIKELKKKFSSSGFIVFLNFHGLSVAKAQGLRRTLRKVTGDYMVSKKTLISVAVKEAGLEIEKNKLEGEVGVAFGGDKEDDILSIAKEIVTFAKKNSEFLKILGGIWGGKWVDTDQIKKLAAIPGKDVLLTQLAFMLLQPVSSLARALNELSKSRN